MDARKCWEDLIKTGKCQICLRIFEKPKTLPCLHSFCVACLEKLARDGSSRQEKEINCPVCLSPFPIPEDNTFSDLRTSFQLDVLKNVMSFANGRGRGVKCSNCDQKKNAISYCYVCSDYLCLRCDQAHRRLRTTRNHRNILLERVQSLLKNPAMCSVEYHEEMPLDVYCHNCLQKVCWICRDEDHRQHDVEDIRNLAEQGKTELHEALEHAKDEVAASKEEVKENSNIFQHREKGVDAARRHLKNNVDLCIQRLEEHERAVLNELDKIYEEQKQAQENKERDLELLVTQLTSSIQHGEGVLQRNLDAEIAQEWEAVVGRCEDLLDSKRNWEPLQLPFVKYLADDEICEKIRMSGTGRVIVSETDPFLSVAKGTGLRDPLVDKVNSFHILTRDSQGNPYYNKDDQIRVKIENPFGEEVQAILQDKKNGKFKITFTPDIVGEHKVQIIVNQQHLIGCPVGIFVPEIHQYTKAYELGSKGQGLERKINYPNDIAICPVTGNIIVCESWSEVVVFSPQGDYILNFGYSGDGTKNLKLPRSVAYSESGRIIIIDNKGMVFYSDRGLFLRYASAVSTRSTVSTSKDGKLIVCDNGNAQVKVHDPSGSLLHSFKIPDVRPRFAIQHEDKYFVSCEENQCVKVFGDDCVFQYDIGALGCDEEKLSSPLGLAIDSFNNLVVCDKEKGRLQIFKLDGRHVATVEGKASRLASPEFIAVSKKGQLFVTDHERGCVHVFH